MNTKRSIHASGDELCKRKAKTAEKFNDLEKLLISEHDKKH